MNIRTLKDINDLKHKKVLVRVDFNVPLEDGKIQDDTRIQAALPTIKYLIKEKARIILITHVGRPGGKIIPELKVDNIAKHLEKLLNYEVKKLDDSIGEKIEKAVSQMNDGEIVMLENIRFHKEEKECDPVFTKKLASLGNIFVNDAFGTAHRKHASTAGIAEFLPSYAGLLMEKEIRELSKITEQEPIRPLTMIFGGAKIDTKIGIIKHFIEKADYFLIGGALANTFLAAAGYNVADSLFEDDKIETAREIMMECEKHHVKIIIPHDVIVADEISDSAVTANIPVEDIAGKMKILDIGKWTTEKFDNLLKESGTVIWNGPLGLCEYKPFQNGTRNVANTLVNHNCISIIGGGDTVDALKRVNVPLDKFTHVSTGGGACIEFLSGDILPGIEILKQ